MITVDLRLPGDLHDALLADVAGRTEWAGYMLCGVLRGDREILLGREWCPVPGRHAVRPGPGTASAGTPTSTSGC